MVLLFGSNRTELCSISNAVLDFIYQHHHHRFWAWNHFLKVSSLLKLCWCRCSERCPLKWLFWFCWWCSHSYFPPNLNQIQVYNGHKRVSSIKFQSKTLPNGLIGNGLIEPWEGRRHDCTLLFNHQRVLYDLPDNL